MLDCLPVILTPTILMKKVITIRYRANPCLTICPCMFMMTTVLVLLHTTIWSMFLGITWTELMWTSPPEVPPKDLKVFWHSVVLVFQTLTVPSDDALLKETNIYHKLINDSQWKASGWTQILKFIHELYRLFRPWGLISKWYGNRNKIVIDYKINVLLFIF